MSDVSNSRLLNKLKHDVDEATKNGTLKNKPSDAQSGNSLKDKINNSNLNDKQKQLFNSFTDKYNLKQDNGYSWSDIPDFFKSAANGLKEVFSKDGMDTVLNWIGLPSSSYWMWYLIIGGAIVVLVLIVILKFVR